MFRSFCPFRFPLLVPPCQAHLSSQPHTPATVLCSISRVDIRTVAVDNCLYIGSFTVCCAGPFPRAAQFGFGPGLEVPGLAGRGGLQSDAWVCQGLSAGAQAWDCRFFPPVAIQRTGVPRRGGVLDVLGLTNS